MRWPAVFAVLAALAGCDDSATSGPFDGLPLDGDFAVGLGAAVHVARDRYGIAHIAGDTIGDTAFVQGYVTAHDRLPQMDILRRFGAGTLAELYGALDASVIDTDLEMRMHRMTPLARQSWGMLQASASPIDRQVVQLVQRYADGVNAYVDDLRRDHWTIDPGLAPSFDAGAFAAWTPIDSLVLVRFWAFAQSWTVQFELDATELYQKLRAAFDDADPGNAAAVARRGISRDLWKLAPVGREPTIAGFPNVTVDTGSRSDGSDPPAGTPAAAPASPPPAIAAARPEVPQAVLDAARAFLASGPHDGPLGALGPHAFGQPYAGGNAWAVGAGLAGDGRVLLATDPHLPLTNPSMFYPTHLIVRDADGDPATADDGLDLLGVTIPGIPGIVVGSNGRVAWAATAAEHDVNDVYLEQIAPCPGGGGDCAAWTDSGGAAVEVPLQSFTEDVAIGALGTITGHTMATYEVVPHHGPVLPAIDRTRHALVPRTAAAALSVRYTGDEPSFEIRALYDLARAASVHDGFAALRDVRFGGQSWTMMDDQQHIGWTTQAYIPVRKPAAYAWDPLVRQDALAPFLVLPGDGAGDWIEGEALSPRYIPHAMDPAQGYLIAANADPVGATFDGLPLDQRTASGEPLYAGAAYAAGLREERITRLLQAGGSPGRTLDDMARIQRDTRSSVGEKLAPAIRAALDRLDSPAGSPADLAPYLAALSPEDRARLDTARALLEAWTFATPAAVDAPDPDSAATALFHTWMHFFIARTLADELDAVGFDVWRLDDDLLVRIVHAMLNDPRSLVTSPDTQQPILCDGYATPGPDESCTVQILAAMIDAMTHLASPAGFGTADTTAWRWGKLHRLAIAPLVPDPDRNLPSPGDPDPAGFPRDGDNFAIDRAGHGWSDLEFSQLAEAPAQRLLAEARPGQAIAVKWALPGGAIYDRRSPHYRDLLDRHYLTDQPFDAPYAIDDIVAAGESRWVFR